MQINGISGHNSDSHQVTNCIHNHTADKKAAAFKALPVDTKASQVNTDLQLMQEGKFSLSAWLQKIFSGPKGLWLKIWGGSETEAPEAAEKGNTVSDTSQVMAQIGTPQINDKSGIAGHEAVNPYFVPLDNVVRPQPNLWQRARMRIHNLTGHLKKQFSGRNSFQTKEERPKEDLRRHSRYRKDDVEVECILTDDSYLLDSYDRKGEYRKLSTKE